MNPQRDNRVKVSSLFRAVHKDSEVANLERTQRSAWTMAKVLTDMQAVAERLSWIVTVCGMPFKAVAQKKS